MRVLHITTHFNMGGIANYILTLSKALKARGVSCVVVSGGGDLEPELNESGIASRRLDIRTKNELHPKVLIAIPALVKIIRQEKIDVVHGHTRVSQVAGLFAAKIAGVPYVTTCHGFFKKRLRKIFDTWGARVVAISDAVARHLKEDLGVSEGRIALIYSGVETQRFLRVYSAAEKDAIRISLGLKDGPVVGTIGRLSDVKGQRFLVEAMPKIISKYKGAQLLIAGNGPEEARLKKLAASLGLGECVHFAGSSPHTENFLSVMDVFVLPSIKEGLGIALLEALAAGKACVASRVGGIENVVKDGVSGLLTDPGDVDGISEAVSSLLGQRGLREDMGRKGQSLVREKFSVDSMADKMIALYKEVLR